MVNVLDGVPEQKAREVEEALKALDWTHLVTRRRNVLREGVTEAHSITLGVNARDGEESRWMREPGVRDVYDRLDALVRAYDPDFTWHSIALNKNLRCAPHVDAGNRSPSIIVGFGDYSGGELLLWPGVDASAAPEARDIRRTFTRFDGAAQLHETAPFEGDRYAAVFYGGGADGKWAEDSLLADLAPALDDDAMVRLRTAVAAQSADFRARLRRVVAALRDDGDDAPSPPKAKRKRGGAHARAAAADRVKVARRERAMAKADDRRAAAEADVSRREAECGGRVVRTAAAAAAGGRLLLFCPREAAWLAAPANGAPRLAKVASLGGGGAAARRATLAAAPAGDGALALTFEASGGALATAFLGKRRALVAAAPADTDAAEAAWVVSESAAFSDGAPLFNVSSRADGKKISMYGKYPHAGVQKDSTCERFLVFRLASTARRSSGSAAALTQPYVGRSSTPARPDAGRSSTLTEAYPGALFDLDGDDPLGM